MPEEEQQRFLRALRKLMENKARGLEQRSSEKKLAISIDAGFRCAEFFLPPMSFCPNTCSFEQLFFAEFAFGKFSFLN